MALVDIKNYLQGLLKLGYGNTSQTPIPTAAFPLDGRTYFESFEQAQSAALLAEQQGSKNTIFYFGMKLVVFENDIVTEYVIIKDPETGKGVLKEMKSAVDIVLPTAYELPVASATQLGGIKVGANLTMEPDGTLSATSSSSGGSSTWDDVTTLIIDGGTADNVDEL